MARQVCAGPLCVLACAPDLLSWLLCRAWFGLEPLVETRSVGIGPGLRPTIVLSWLAQAGPPPIGLGFFVCNHRWLAVFLFV